MLRLLRLLGAAAAASTAPGGALAPGQCRCRAPQPCWRRVDFTSLNTSVGGRLEGVADEMASCLREADSAECRADLNSTDSEFFYTGRVGGFMHTGLADGPVGPGWSIAHPLAALAVAAEGPADVAATVRFAAQHNLRLAVKGTGHDWFGRSGSHPDLEGALMLWTHRMKSIEWHAAEFTAEGCADDSSVAHAVSVGAGVQFADLYPEAEKRGRLVNGGTCTSVGVGGCTLGGCFGPFSQRLGPAASNLLQAKVVLANGTAATVSKCSHPDLFWALRGGGAGFAVVTEFTFRSYRSPDYLTRVGYSGSVGSGKAEDIEATAVEVLRAANEGFLAANQGWNGDINVPVSARFSNFSISLSTYEGNATAALPLFDRLDAWVKSRPAAMQVSGRKVAPPVRRRPQSGTWAQAGAPEGQVRLPWDDPHHDNEIGTEHLISMSKWLTRTALGRGTAEDSDAGLRTVAAALANVSRVGCGGPLEKLCTLPAASVVRGRMGMDKSQGNANKRTRELFAETSQNPVLLETVGFMTSQWHVPSLPQLPRTSATLRSLWARFQKYAGIEAGEPLHATCAAGAAGNETQAADCFAQWAERRATIVAQLAKLRATMNWHFPTAGGYAGSYWNEADYYEPHWQRSFWSDENYRRLLAVKRRWDPDGLLACHHCVGSELLSTDGNCRLT